MNSTLGTLRGLLRELRRASSEGSARKSPLYSYLMAQYRKHQLTEKQICKANEELNFLAHSYLCYLRSTRVCKEINEEYSGKGERSIAETANMVGFKLPHDPK